MRINYKDNIFRLSVDRYMHQGINMVGILLEKDEIRFYINKDIPPLDEDWVILDNCSYDGIENELLNRGVILNRVTTLYLGDRQYPVYEINKSLMDKKRDKTQKCFISHK